MIKTQLSRLIPLTLAFALGLVLSTSAYGQLGSHGGMSSQPYAPLASANFSGNGSSCANGSCAMRNNSNFATTPSYQAGVYQRPAYQQPIYQQRIQHQPIYQSAPVQTAYRPAPTYRPATNFQNYSQPIIRYSNPLQSQVYSQYRVNHSSSCSGY